MSEGLGVQPAPVVGGTQRSGLTPLPQKKIPMRVGMAAPSAYAVPFELNIASRGGRATPTAAPPITPRRTVLRLIFGLDIGVFSLRQPGRMMHAAPGGGVQRTRARRNVARAPAPRRPSGEHRRRDDAGGRRIAGERLEE